MKIQGNLSLLLGITIPIAMIIFVAASIYLPGIFVKPSYNFLYTTTAGYSYGTLARYSVGANGTLVETPPTPPKDQSDWVVPLVTIYRYDVAKNTSTSISYEQARTLHLVAGDTSPDGFMVKHGSSGGGFPFFFYSDSNYNTEYLVRGSASRKLNIVGGYYNFEIIGWITQ